MAWTDGEGVMTRVEKLIRALYQKFATPDTSLPPLPESPFHRITYDAAMSHYGSDKPDLRIPGLVCYVSCSRVPLLILSDTTD